MSLTDADVVHGHVAVVNATKPKLGPNVTNSDARHGQVCLQAAQLQDSSETNKNPKTHG